MTVAPGAIAYSKGFVPVLWMSDCSQHGMLVRPSWNGSIIFRKLLPTTTCGLANILLMTVLAAARRPFFWIRHSWAWHPWVLMPETSRQSSALGDLTAPTEVIGSRP